MLKYKEIYYYLSRPNFIKPLKDAYSEYYLLNDIMRATFYSALNRKNYYKLDGELRQQLHVDSFVKSHIQKLATQEGKRICNMVIAYLERHFTDFDKDKPILKNLWLFAEFTLKQGKDFIFTYLYNENKMINWEILTITLCKKDFNLETSAFYKELQEYNLELNKKYKK